MIEDIKWAAGEVGITAIITNSTEKIETQLNRITGIEDLPIMLVSWDLITTLEFDQNGFLNNPSTKVVLLLMTKADDTTKEAAERSAELMGELFQMFLQKLYSKLVAYQRDAVPPISGAEYTLVPQHGLGKHSGILGRFTMLDQISNCP